MLYGSVSLIIRTMKKSSPSPDQSPLFHDAELEIADWTGSTEIGRAAGAAYERVAESQERQRSEVLTGIDREVAHQAHTLLDQVGRALTGGVDAELRGDLVSRLESLEAVHDADRRHAGKAADGYEGRRYREETPDDHRDRTFIERGVAADLAAIKGASAGDPDRDKVREHQNRTAPDTRERRKGVVVERRLAREFGDVVTALRERLEDLSDIRDAA